LGVCSVFAAGGVATTAGCAFGFVAAFAFGFAFVAVGSGFALVGFAFFAAAGLGAGVCCTRGVLRELSAPDGIVR
jgi:hypothetical protein